MPRMVGSGLSRREREILDILYREGKTSAAQVHAALPDAPTYSTVRTLLGVLEGKGHIRHEADGKRFLYLPTAPRQEAARSALQQVLATFFGGSLTSAAKTFLNDAEASVADEELVRLAELIEASKGEAL